MMMRALLEAQHPTATNFVPVAIDPEARIIWAIVEQPTVATSVAEGVDQRAFEEIPMLAVASQGLCRPKSRSSNVEGGDLDPDL